VNFQNFFAELKRRNVYKVAIAYGVVAWLLMQIASQIFPFFDIPNWVVRLVVLGLILGFPIALIIAWAFELTPEGIKRTEVADALPAAARSKKHVWIYVVVICGAISVTLFFLGRYTAQTLRPASNDLRRGKQSEESEASTVPKKSIAVLPFENFSEDKGNEYFADGMQDMILTKLAGIGDLKVISRASTAKYQSRPDNLKTVATELGVATILEGSVQKAGDEVLINVQLIDAANDNHLWADAYSRKLDNIFGVEGEVAQKVADALKAKLTPAETAHVAEAPTRNAAAFDVFLQAEEQAQKANTSESEVAYLAADTDYLRAIALDPGFALAYARLALNQLNRHWFATPLTASQLATTKAYADRALALAPNLPEAHLALGYYDYWGFRKYVDANIEFKRALALAPNNVNALIGLAFVARRTGQMAQALNYMKQAVAISPRDPMLLREYGLTFTIVRRYAEADTQVRRSLILSPDNAGSYDDLLTIQLFGFGDADATRNAVKSLPGWRLGAISGGAGDIIGLVNTRIYADVFARRFDAALHAWDSAPIDTEEERRTGKVARAVIKLIAGDRKSAQADCASLEPVLTAELAKQPDSLGLLQQLSWVDVCLGRNAEAIAAAQKAVKVLPISKDAFFGTYQLVGLAQIAAWADAPDLALKTIRQLLAMPAGATISIERLKLDPVFDPLRKDPRFRKLIEDGETAEKAQAKP
jgi:TolB-like protein